MKIFIEIESGECGRFPNLEGAEEVIALIDEARAEAQRDLLDGGIYEDGTPDEVVKLGVSGSDYMGRLIMTTNKEMKISD